MNWLDVAIVLVLVASVVRGQMIGFIRQFFSTAGFLLGFVLGAWLQHAVFAHWMVSPMTKSVVALLTMLGGAFGGMTGGEYIGIRLQARVHETKFARGLDRIFGAVLAAVTLLAIVWLGAAVFRVIPVPFFREQIGSSRIVAALNKSLPPASNIVGRLGYLIDPNSPPMVFAGLEPALNTDTPLPDLGPLQPAVEKVRASTIKVQGMGCGGIVEGSGFVAADGHVITNAHVVAGVEQPFVVDTAGQHNARVVWFDPDLDIAVLKTSGLAGPPLHLESRRMPNGTNAVVLGYPGGGGLTVGPAVILESFTAEGRDIYNEGHTERQVYSAKADIEHGNSGGPLVAQDGSVIGVIFAESTSYNEVGYALAMEQVIAALNQATQQSNIKNTGACAR